MKRNCLKCGYVKEDSDWGELEACPNCGAIYAKVERAKLAQEAASEIGTMSRFHDSKTQRRTAEPMSTTSVLKAPSFMPEVNVPYIQVLRADSAYATYRAFVKFFYILGMAIPVLAVVGYIANSLLSKQWPPLLQTIGGAAILLFIVLVARLYRNISLMLCDMADASIKSAEMMQKLLIGRRDD